MTIEEATIQALQGHIEALNEIIEKQDKAIKALEQELILDKIRAEIERGKTGLDIEFNSGIDYALSIIDKYKADRSVEE